MIGEDTETSLRDDLASAFDAQTPTDDAPPDAPAEAVAETPAIELPALEAPERWDAKYKETFGKLATHPEFRSAAEAWVNQYKESQGYLTKKEQEAADLRKQLDPLRETLAPYEQVWQRQGMTSQQGVSQLLGWAQALAANPQQTLMELAKSYNVNLQELVSSQPYTDPQVQALEQRLAQMQQQFQQQQQMGQQSQYNQVLEQLKSFETATDEQGKPKHPYYSRVFDQMVGLAKGGLAKGIEDAYAKAVALDPEIQAEIAKEKAAAEAATRAAEAKKAAEASRRVQGKSTEVGDKPERGLRQDIAATAAEMGFN